VSAKSSLVLGSIGFGVTGVAALAGCFRFAGIDVVVRVHDVLTSLATLLGLPLIAAGVLLAGEIHLSSHRLNGLIPLVLMLTIMAGRLGYIAKVAMPLSQLAGALIALKGIFMLFHSFYGGVLLLTGVASAVFAGNYATPRRKNKKFGPFLLGVDLFHYLYALALVLFGYGIVQLTVEAPQPVLMYWVQSW
jgi:hypothetical protein